MALNFSDLVNDVHRNAMGANGRTGLDFFVQQPFVPNVVGNVDRDGDGAEDSTYLFRMTGANTLRATEQTGLQGVITLSGKNGNVEIPYNPADSVQTLVTRINNSDSEVKAYLDRENRLVLKATTASDRQNPDFVIRHVEDSGFFLTGYAGVLAGAGADNAYDFNQTDAVNTLAGVAAGDASAAEFSVAPVLNPSAYMAVNQAITQDVLSVASAYAGVSGYAESGDGRAASEIAAIRNTAVMIGRNRTIDDYFAESIAKVGENGRAAKLQTQSQNTIMGDLRTLRESISGVNTDEELANLIKFQHGYNAAARFVSVVDNLLDTVINRMGV
jgi:flagellar hook-associated protein 1 FlgK